MKNLLFALLVLPILQTGCKENSNPDLTDYKWRLIEVYGTQLPDSVKATLFLAPFEPICNGKGGCNAYGADYAWDGNDLQFNNLVHTERACLGIMDWETDFFEALLETRQYRIADGKLYLLRDDAEIAVLE